MIEGTCRQIEIVGRNRLGKRAPHYVVIDQVGTVLLSKRFENHETAMLELIATVAEIAAGDEACWGQILTPGARRC